MALNFPDSPSDGDIFQGFTYNSSKGVWNSAGVSDTAVTVYANLAAFPSSGNTVGDYAFATDTKALYVWDGTEWDRISTGNNETPRLTTTPASTLTLDGTSGSTGSLTIAASDPEGFPITYSYDTNPSSPNQITNVSESNGTFTLTPSTNSAHAGNFTLRLKASDGISTTSHAVTVTLAFIKSYRYIKVVINSVQGGGSQAQVTELSIADTAQTTSQVTAQTYTTYGSASQNPNGILDNNSTGSNTGEYTNLNFSGGNYTAEIDLGQAYNVGSGIKYLQIGTSDSSGRFPNSVTVYGANQSNYSDEEAIVTNASVPAYDGVRQMKLVDLDP